MEPLPMIMAQQPTHVVTPSAPPFPDPETGTIPTEQVDQPSNDERWSLIWGALIIYWAIDAIGVFLLAFLGFLATMIFYIAAPSDCSVAPIMFLLASLIFVTRFVDMVVGCCTIGCWFCSFSGDGRRQERTNKQLLPHIRNCILICSAQCILSLAQIAFAIVGLVQSSLACAGSTVSIVFAILLILDAGWELFIWIGAYILRVNQDQATIPPIVDKIIPQFLYDWARRTRL